MGADINGLKGVSPQLSLLQHKLESLPHLCFELLHHTLSHVHSPLSFLQLNHHLPNSSQTERLPTITLLCRCKANKRSKNFKRNTLASIVYMCLIVIDVHKAEAY